MKKKNIQFLLVALFLIIRNSNIVAQTTFTAYFPKNNFVTDITPVFQWNIQNTASSYDIEISPNIDFSGIYWSENTTTTQSTPPTQLSFGTYYWRIRANTPSGAVYTPTYTFEIFNPNQLPSIQLWLRADSNLVLDGLGRIEQWQDLSPNAHHLTQTNGAKRPVIESVALNNLPSVRFNGGQVMDGGDILDIDDNSRTVLLVTKAEGPNQSFYAKSLVSAQPNRYGYIREGNSLILLHHSNSVNNIVTPWNNVNYNFHSNVHNRQTGYNHIFLNFNHTASNTFNPTISMNSSYRFILGAYNNAADNGELYYLNGNISEMIIVNSVNEQDLNLLQRYLTQRYAPSVNLGSDITVNHGSCNPTILDAGSHFTSYLWSTGATTSFISTTQSDTYWVEVTDMFGFTSSDTIVVSYPEIQIPDNLTFCPSQTVTWSVGLGSDYTYLWNTGEITESIDISVTGNYSVTVTDTLGCQITSDLLYFEEDPFSSDVSLGPDASLCSGNQLALESGASEATDYVWNTGENTPSILITTSGTYYVDVINGNGCTASDTIEVTIIGEAPVVVPVLPSEICAGEEFSFTENSYTTDGSSITGRFWSFGDGHTTPSQSGEHLFTTHDTTYTVSLVINSDSGCENHIHQTITVRPQIVFDFNTSGVCQLADITFNGVSSDTGITGWEWDFGEPSSGSNNTASGQNTVHSFQTSGNFDVSLIAENAFGCRDTLIKTISVSPAPTANFTFNEVCQGGIVSFTNQSTITSPHTITSNVWNFGGSSTSTLLNPTRQYMSAGTFPVTLTVTGNNGCSYSLADSIIIHANPQTSYTYSASCAGLKTTFTDNSTIINDAINQVSWIFNNEPMVIGSEVSFTFPEPGIHQVRQIVTSTFGCQQTTTTSVITHPELKAEFSTASDILLSEVPTVFENESIGADNYEWSVGDLYTGNDTNPEVTFPANYVGGSVLVSLIAGNTYGCSDTFMRTYSVSQLRSDIAITQLLFHTDEDGYSIFAVELKNLGTVPVTKADVYFKTTNNTPIKATWEGELKFNEQTIFITPASSYQAVNIENKGYVCAEVKAVLPAYFEDDDLSNNELCKHMEKEGDIFIIPFPNPASGDLSVRVIMPESEVVSLFIYDLVGNEVKRIVNDATLPKGLSVFTFSIEQWTAGMYTVVLRGKSEIKQVKVIKR